MQGGNPDDVEFGSEEDDFEAQFLALGDEPRLGRSHSTLVLRFPDGRSQMRWPVRGTYTVGDQLETMGRRYRISAVNDTDEIRLELTLVEIDADEATG